MQLSEKGGKQGKRKKAKGKRKKEKNGSSTVDFFFYFFWCSSGKVKSKKVKSRTVKRSEEAFSFWLRIYSALLCSALSLGLKKKGSLYPSFCFFSSPPFSTLLQKSPVPFQSSYICIETIRRIRSQSNQKKNIPDEQQDLTPQFNSLGERC